MTIKVYRLSVCPQTVFCCRGSSRSVWDGKGGWDGVVVGGGHCDCPLTAEDGWGLVQLASSVWTQPQIGLSGHKNGTLLWVSLISNKWRQQVQVERGRRLHPSELKWLQMNYFNEKRKRLSVFSAVQSDIYFRT